MRGVIIGVFLLLLLFIFHPAVSAVTSSPTPTPRFVACPYPTPSVRVPYYPTRTLTPTPTPWNGTYNYTFDGKKLTVNTSLMSLAIEAGEIIYVKDNVRNEVLVNTSAYTNRPSVSSGYTGFTSKGISTGNYYKRWPEQSTTTVTFTQVLPSKGRLVYTPLTQFCCGDNGNGVFTIDVSVDTASGEILIEENGREATTGDEPFTLDLPIAKMNLSSVILGKGRKYVRSDPAVTVLTDDKGYGIRSPIMAVAEGSASTLAVWAENSYYANIQLNHTTEFDQLVLTTSSDPITKNTDSRYIASPIWRIGVYKNWMEAARRWKTRFEQTTGTKPLWNRTSWINKIHSTYQYGNNTLVDKNITNLVDVDKLLYFIWNGDRIVLFGDHTLVKSPGTKPTTDETSLINVCSMHSILYHPYTLISSEVGWDWWKNYLISLNWLPDGYIFNPDYSGEAEAIAKGCTGDRLSLFECYWNDVKTIYDDGSRDYVLQIGAKKTQDYLLRNFPNYIQAHNAKGAYLDMLGDEGRYFFAGTNKEVIDGQDYVRGNIQAFNQLKSQRPEIGVMSEYQSEWILPYIFYTWEGTETYKRQSTYLDTIKNHPLRAALVSSYVWAREDNEEVELDYIQAAYLGTLPQISFTGDYSSKFSDNKIPASRAEWSQRRAKLFNDAELFHDLPNVWDSKAYAYYRTKNDTFIKLITLNGTLAYIEELPGGGEAIRLCQDPTKCTGVTPFPTSSPITPSPTTIPCGPAGDVDCNGTVNLIDLSRLLSKFGQSGNMPEDIDKNGVVNLVDLSMLLSNFGKSG
jgi:hypothetical protein